MKGSFELPLTDDAITTFIRDGAICLRNVIDEATREKLCAAIERDILDPGPFFHNYQIEKGRFHGNSLCWPRHAEFRDYVLHSPLPQLAASLMGARRLNLVYDQLFVKEPGTEAPTPWHQDLPVWPLEGDQIVSFWLALDPVTAASGAVEYVRGSHRWNRLFQPYSFAKSSIDLKLDPSFEPMPDIDAMREQLDIATWEMAPGDIVAFTARTIHGAGGNRTAHTRRRGYSVRYAGEDVTYKPRRSFVPALKNAELRPGDKLDSKLFPLVWRNGRAVTPYMAEAS